ncbi:IclR family transcriptional regulator [Streptomyces sp. TG1A-8]|uniref:IclR family transcriptional regulator n=1 Tax=Streptomyces sp. TG1A-8 TaxID=3051385 RepID=UPI00265C1C15|nr:IclR family transcriptional regulator [Streptomyces sp. TG1A-8]MDO0929645.1 IclR family transcriptional regulator [Streptomyces sp. TG1A-8]
MTAQDKPSNGIRSMNSVLSTLRVLEEVAMRQPIGVSELARATQIPKSSVQRCLVTLQQAGWLRVVDREHARWGVTMKALAIGLRGAGEQDLRDLAVPVVKRLAAETDETVQLGLRDGEDYVIVATQDSTQVVRVFLEVGTRVPLRATSAGVAIMSHLEPADVDELLKHELREFAHAPVPSSEEIREEIERTTRRGYALNVSGWFRPHVASIASAITDSTGQPIAGLTLSIPQMRYDNAQEEALAQLVVAAADEISKLISSS